LFTVTSGHVCATRTPSAFIVHMASDDLDISQFPGVQDSGPPDKPSFPLPHIGHASSPSDNHVMFALPTPILRNFRNPLDVPGSPASHTSNASSHPPPSPTLSAHSTGSIRWATATVLRDNNPEEHDGLSSLVFLPLRRRDIIEREARAQSQVLAVSSPTPISKILRVLGSAPCVPVTLTCRAPSPPPPILTWMLDQTPHTLRQRPASSRGLYSVSVIRRHLLAATPTFVLPQHDMIAFRKEATTQMSSAREPNSRGRLSWISSKKLT